MYREPVTLEVDTDENHNERMEVKTSAADLDETPSSPGPGASWLLSGIYCMLIVILSVVICSTYHITENDTQTTKGKISQTTVEAYFVILYLIGIIWLVAFKPLATSCCTEGAWKFKEVKSIHTSNRWLKAILVVFGVAIVVKDLLDFLAIFEFDEDDCKKPIYFVSPVAQVLFVGCEVNFLFRYSKIHLQDNRQISRFGAMHVMATNLSIWMLIIIDEAMGYFDDNLPENEDHLLGDRDGTIIVTTPKPYQLPTTNHSDHTNAAATYYHTSHGECKCNTTYCQAVSEAHVFLYPFLIEFSLVASCMIYIVWRNIDTVPQYNLDQPHPVYKFYQSYIGFIGGGVVLVGTMVVLIVINNIPSASNPDPSYHNEIPTIEVFNSFMVLIELIMLAVCIIGLLLLKKDCRPVKMDVTLDVVLLMVSLTGSATLNVFYAFSVYVTIITQHHFIWGAVYPVVDLVECIVQVALLLWGLSRQASVSHHPAPTAIKTGPSSSPTAASSFTNEAFEIDEKSGSEQQHGEDTIPTGVVVNEDSEESKTSAASSSGVFTMHSPSGQTESTSTSVVTGYCDEVCIEEEGGEIVIEKEMGAASIQEGSSTLDRPNKTRIKIRNALMFLLIANACIWVFWSLENTAFKLFTYPYQYYTQTGYDAPNIWHTTTMFCLPLSIFFRMHSCACLFEVWSFT